MTDELELKVGRMYRAKRPRIVGVDELGRIYNDRRIIYVDEFEMNVQYDGPSVADGRHYPRTSAEAFRKWARGPIEESL